MSIFILSRCLQNRYIVNVENKYFHQLLGQSLAHISDPLYLQYGRQRDRASSKSRRIEATQGSRTHTLLAAEQITAQQQNVTQDSDTCTMQQQIQSCISAAIPDITSSVITALTAHGLICPLHVIACNQQQLLLTIHQDNLGLLHKLH